MDVLIVDDEWYAVKALVTNVDWKALGFGSVHEAYSVSEARRIIESNDVKVLISDIEMPGASGIDLLEWVRGAFPDIAAVFLTCHSDFQYVRQGLHFGLAEYLLKPVEYEELRKVVSKLVEKLEHELENKRYNDTYKKYYKLWEEQKSHLVERFWQNLVEERYYPPADVVRELTEAYNIPLGTADRVQPVLIGIEQWYKELNLKDEEIMNYALRNAAEEMLADGRGGTVFRDRNGNLVAILYAEADAVELETRCRTFIQACDRYLFCSLSCYVGKPASLSGLPAAYLSLMKAFRSNVTRSRDCVQVREDRLDERFGKNPPPPVDSWRVLLETGKTEELLLRIDAYLDEVGRERLTAETLHALYHTLANLIYHVFHKLGLSVHDLFEWQEGHDLPQATRTLTRFRSWAHTVVGEAVRVIRDRGGDHSAVVSKVKQFVADNIDNEFTREDIASYVYLNSDYVSRLFRKETAQSLQDYIIQLKINRAKELLVTTNEKVSDVGEKIGYSNIPYFTSLFKRVVGLSPQEFRKKYQE